MLSDEKAKEQHEMLIAYILKHNRLVTTDASKDMLENITNEAVRLVDLAELDDYYIANGKVPFTYIIPLLSDDTFERLINIHGKEMTRLECIESIQYEALFEEQSLRKRKSNMVKEEYLISLKIINLALARIVLFGKKFEQIETITELSTNSNIIKVYQNLKSHLKVNLQNNKAV